MAKKDKELKCSAYIDGGKIAIIDEDGMNYQVEINKVNSKINFLNKIMKYLFIVGGTIFLSAMVNYFKAYLTSTQFEILMSGSVMSVFIILLSFFEKTEVLSRLDIWNSEFNLAKNILQKDLLNLEKELIKHEKEIEEIRQSQSLDFIQNFKKEESNTPKTLLKEINR